MDDFNKTQNIYPNLNAISLSAGPLNAIPLSKYIK